LAFLQNLITLITLRINKHVVFNVLISIVSCQVGNTIYKVDIAKGTVSFRNLMPVVATLTRVSDLLKTIDLQSIYNFDYT